MNGFTWCIEVHISTFSCSTVFVNTTGGAKNCLLWASKANPSKRVTLTAMARTRMVMENGEIVKDNPDLTAFYNNVTPQEQHLWKEII